MPMLRVGVILQRHQGKQSAPKGVKTVERSIFEMSAA